MGIIRKQRTTVQGPAVQFSLKLFNDKSTAERLKSSSAVEIMFTDPRNVVPAEYFETLQKLQPGDSVEITVRRVMGG